MDVEWRCPVRGHPSYVDQPKHVHELLRRKQKTCPLCKAGLRAEAWTKPRIIAFVRSMENYLDQLSPADRYQLLLQTGLLNSGGGWAVPVVEAILHGSGKASHAALTELVGDLEPEVEASDLFKRLRKHTAWSDDSVEKATRSGSIRKRFEHWCASVDHETKLEAIRSTCAPRPQRHLETLWRYAPALGKTQPDELRQVLLDLFPRRGLKLESIAGAPPDLGLERVDSLLWRLSACKEHDAALVGLRDKMAAASQARSKWLLSSFKQREDNAPPARRSAEVTAQLLRELLSSRHRATTVAELRQICGPDVRDEKTALRLWRVAPSSGEVGEGEDAFRRLMREALPDVAFDSALVSPAAPASEALEIWKQRTIGEVAVEQDESLGVQSRQVNDGLPSDKVGQILDVSERLLFADYDMEAVDYFLSAQVAKLWSVAFEHTEEALLAAKQWAGSDFGNQVRDAFLHEAHEVEHLHIP